MQRALSIALSLAAVALSAVLAFRSVPGLAGVGTDSASASTATPHPPAPSPMKGEGELANKLPSPPVGEGPGVRGREDSGAPTLDDAGTTPSLGKGAPRHIRFGVVLVTYEGAEGADKGARRRSDALDLATKLAEEAKGDFHATVQRGDTGSTDDLGTVTRGVLEPASEAILFALPVGSVSGVIDTPRGFWIAKRIE